MIGARAEARPRPGRGRLVFEPCRIPGSILESFGGTGENALFFAGRAYEVLGIDFRDEPIIRARAGANADWRNESRWIRC